MDAVDEKFPAADTHTHTQPKTLQAIVSRCDGISLPTGMDLKELEDVYTEGQ